MSTAEVRVVGRKPSVAEYLALAESVGWSRFVSAETASTALANTLFAVVAEQGERAVGMGRIVGDGALFFYIQDVVVEPDLQGRKLGATLIRHLMAWLDRNAPDRAFVGLFSATGKAPFYEQFGFAAAGPERPGMFQYLRLPE